MDDFNAHMNQMQGRPVLKIPARMTSQLRKDVLQPSKYDFQLREDELQPRQTDFHALKDDF